MKPFDLSKAIIDNPDLPEDFIKDILESKSQDKALAEPFEIEE